MAFFDQSELTKIDGLLANVENGATGNMDLVRQLSTISIKVTGDLSALRSEDPHSEEYLSKIKLVHEEIIGREHKSEFEGLPELNPEYERQWPYPWGTRDAETVARMLIAYGFLIKVAGLPKNARILEVGCGMGSLTWNLARMGYRVDALDPNPTQCQCVAEMTKDFPVRPQLVAATLDEWLDRRPRNYKYDAVIFFESFHHLMDHKVCVERLTRDGHIEDDAKIILAAEPLLDHSSDILPYPWGPRLDGESLRAMRRWGWLELGFTKNYIRELFARVGLSYSEFQTEAALPLSQVVVGSRPNLPPYFEVPITPESACYEATLADGFDASIDGFPSFLKQVRGLSITEPWGRWTIGKRIELIFHEKLPSKIELVIELNDVFGPNVGKDLRVVACDSSATVRLLTVEECSTYRFELTPDESRTVIIHIPAPCRPKDMPEIGSEDARRLGLGIRSIRFNPL